MEMAATSTFASFSCCARELKCGRNAGWRTLRARAGVFCSSPIPDSRSKSWSDANLINELQEFIAGAGLPADRVPSTKELASNGRQDLANVVRRRGYRAVTELMNQVKVESSEGSSSSTSPPASTLLLNGSASELSGQRTSLHDLKIMTPPRDTHSDSDLAAKAEHFIRTGQLADTEASDDESLYSSDDDEDDEFVDGIELEHETSEAMALKKAAMLRSKLLPFINSRETGSAEAEVGEKLVAANKKVHELLQKDKVPGSQSKAQVMLLDPEDPKALLQARDKELSLLGRELEEAKAHLALVQAKATAELAQAKQIAIEKDMRLSAAENALTNLKQVKIEWWGTASKVEIAGSFNGWQHFFVLEPDLSSEIRKPDGTRGPLMWETELWLYPGVYEMKFIVDGDWQVDHRREVAMKNMNQNNILRVDL